MKIAVFHPENQFCSWSMGAGIAATLRRMGHDVVDVVMPSVDRVTPEFMEQVKKDRPIEVLQDRDLLFISGPEYVTAWIEACYGKAAWTALQIPKAAWLHESCRREDKPINVENFSWVAEQYFFAGIQDAEFHDQEGFLPGRSHFLPLAVDTHIFFPQRTSHDTIQRATEFDLAFIGLLYPKRQLYLQALSRHSHPPIKMGSVVVHDIHGIDAESTARRLAANYRSIKVFLNLPALSNMLVSKVTEVMACGTFLLTPELPDDGKKNMKCFESGKHLVYYKASNLPYVAQLMRDWTSPEKDAERQAIAEAGCREVHEKHSLSKRLEEMISVVANGEKDKLSDMIADYENRGNPPRFVGTPESIAANPFMDPRRPENQE